MKENKKELRIAGMAYSLLFLLLYLLRFNEKLLLLYISALLFVLSIIYPVAIKPLYLVLKPAGEFLINLIIKIILILIFYLLFTPIAIIRRFTGATIIEKQFDRNRVSYFIDNTQVEYNKDFFKKLY